MKAVIYARYSSDNQREESIEAQVRACKDYAATKGLVVVSEYVDEAISGKGEKTATRASYQRMIRDSGKGMFDVILCHKYDRISRNLAEHVNLEIKLQNKGVELIAAAQDFGNSKESKIVKALMWSMSEYFLDNLSDEVRKGHKENAIVGKHNGGFAPFGYNVENQKYIINELEAEYVRRMFDAAQNKTGFNDLINEMDARGIRGRFGKPIKYTQIYEILRNIKYAGIYAYNPEKEKSRADQRSQKNAIKVEGVVPAIISQSQFQEVQKIMESRKHAGRKAGYLCSGLVYCSCGAKMHGVRRKTNKDKDTPEYRYYYCSAKCGAPSVRMEEIDNAAKCYLQELLAPSNQEKISAALRLYQSNESNRLEAFYGALKRKIDGKQKQYDALLANLSTGALPASVVASIGEQMQELQNEIEALRDTAPPEDYTPDHITAWLESLKAAPDDKAIQLLIERIDIKSKMDFSIESTLKSIVGNLGTGEGT